ncbi:hypothetical protein Ciccas_001172 [Cichlidogyrus casuarinus]|uniref:Uncharacterized protein n=1 Tax=Cichlidogyrus casuarinus TaxID=1844966 RepID=A0ABD2QKS8_9PLAT
MTNLLLTSSQSAWLTRESGVIYLAGLVKATVFLKVIEMIEKQKLRIDREELASLSLSKRLVTVMKSSNDKIWTISKDHLVAAINISEYQCTYFGHHIN